MALAIVIHDGEDHVARENTVRLLEVRSFFDPEASSLPGSYPGHDQDHCEEDAPDEGNATAAGHKIVLLVEVAEQ